MKTHFTIAMLISTLCVTVTQAQSIDEFVIGLEEEVSEGVPGPGAGSIEEPGALDIYTFTVNAGTEVFFHEVWQNNINLRWKCEDPNEAELFDSQFGFANPGQMTLDITGTYTITAYGSGDHIGQYSFIIWEINPPDVFAIDLEEEVSEGVPGPGAGSIEEPGSLDIYTFTADAGTEVFFHEVWQNNINLRWKCEDPNQVELFDSQFGFANPGQMTLAVTGTYTITVYGSDEDTGEYSFTVWVVNLPEEFVIGLEEEVSEGVPGPGAGSIEEPAAIDIYTFTANAGTEVYFHEVWQNNINLRWKCEDPNQVELFDSQFGFANPGQMTLDVTGTYTITAYGSEENTGEYTFIIWEVNPPEEFVIGLEEEVSEGVPGPGAGSIEEPAAIDIYTFTANAGTEVFFHEVWHNNINLRWKCEDPNQVELFDSQFGFAHPGQMTLDLTGTYTITVYGSEDHTGEYSFTVWEVNPPEMFTIGLDEVVSEGAPGPGAGSIEEPAAIDIYSFTVAANTDVCFEELWHNNINLHWKCEDPNQVELFDSQFGFDYPGRMTLEVAGTYTITVYGEEENTGEYSFVVHEAIPSDLTGDCYVNIDDIFAVLGLWGDCPDPCPPYCEGDITEDCTVNIDDIFAILGQWGQ